MDNDAIWNEIEETARKAGLDPSKFGPIHREIADLIFDFLSQSAEKQPTNKKERGWLQSLIFSDDEPAAETQQAPVQPIIICGIPGTGKTTFLYVLDTVFRRIFDLPDHIQPKMQKADGREHLVPKRTFLNQPISLLSVRKWTEILHFYGWDIEDHRFEPADQAKFIETTLQPMRMILADEVEMTGYSPTIPTLAKSGLLVIGTSNQTQFVQLESEDVPAVVRFFEGVDMRVGDPDDAVVSPQDPERSFFDELSAKEPDTYGILNVRSGRLGDQTGVLIDFKAAVQAPFLESQWIQLLQSVYQKTNQTEELLEPESRLLLLLDDFSLDELRTDFNGIIRFVSLFDAVEQLCLGVLVSHPNETPTLSREALQHMKVTVNAARGITEDIKKKTVVGVDRASSRIGQAGHRAIEQIKADKLLS